MSEADIKRTEVKNSEVRVKRSEPEPINECARSVAQCPTLQPHGLWPTGLLCPWNSTGKNPGVGSHLLLQGVFPIQGLNPGLLHCRRMDLLPSEPPTASEHKTFLEFNFKGI